MVIDKPVSVSDAIRKTFDSLQPGTEFSGYDFRNMVAKNYPDASGRYVDSILRVLRMDRRSQFINIDRQKSLYRKCVPTQ